MKYFKLVFLAVFIMAGCNNAAKQLKERIAGADSIAVNFYKDNGKMDAVIAVEIIRDKKAVEMLTDFITAENTSERTNCSVNGSLHFFKNDAVIQNIYFNRNIEGCNRFQFIMDHHTASTLMNTESRNFLNGLLLHRQPDGIDPVKK